MLFDEVKSSSKLCHFFGFVEENPGELLFVRLLLVEILLSSIVILCDFAFAGRDFCSEAFYSPVGESVGDDIEFFVELALDYSGDIGGEGL